MAIYKRCSHCHRLYTGKECPECKPEREKAYQRRRLKENDRLKLYHSRVWRRCRDTVIMRYFGYDVWLLGIGIWHVCDPAYIHHILERDERPDLLLDIDNLIPVTHASHEEIHGLYSTGHKEQAIQRINDGKEAFLKRFGDEHRG